MKTVLVFLCIGLELLGIIVFLHGFFPIKSVIKESTSWDTVKLEPSLASSTGKPLPPVFGRVVFVLIDALRADFVLPSDASDPLPHMMFVEERLRQGEAKGFLARAQPPTVTMPRIKALMTGSIPGFVDVALNFASQAVEEDSVIRQLHNARRRVVFYGDDTWMRLFPGMFEREEGTTSFFVTDYTEVDNNVTRHLPSELSRSDWDVLVLHYLGLDHIGHLAGPRSPLVKPKLDEMDSIVQRVYESISEEEKDGLPSVLVLCGDHGMSEQGSHGGATFSEVATPLVMISPLWRGQTESPQKYEEVLQIDMAPSLSLLLGLPTPQSSLGVLLAGLMDTKPWRHRLQAAYVNSQQVATLFKGNMHGAENEAEYQQLERAWSMHTSWLELQYNATNTDLVHLQAQKVAQQYRVAMTAMRNKMAASLATYDIHAMAVGCFIVWMVLIALLLIQYLPAIVTSSIFHSSSFLLSVLLLSLVFMAVHVIACTSSEASAVLCPTWGFVPVILVSVVVAGMAVVLVREMRVRDLKQGARKHLPSSLFGKVLLVGTIAHSASLCASSFVEEEHQTWYFLSLTTIVLLLIRLCRGYFTPYSNKKRTNSASETNNDFDHDVRTRNLLNRKTDDDLDANSVKLLTENLRPEGTRRRQVTVKDIGVAIVALVLCRVLRGWNRTGDKWATIPDIGDWLVRPDNKLLLSTVSMVSLIIIGLLQPRRSPWLFHLSAWASLIGVYAFRAVTGVFLWPWQSEGSKGIVEARIVYACITVLLVYSMINRTSGPSKQGSEAQIPSSTQRENQLRKRKPSDGDIDTRQYMELDQGTSKSLQNSDTVMADTAEETQGTAEKLYYIWALFMALLVRPHNISVVAMEMCLVTCLQHLVEGFLAEESSSILTLFYIWMGHAAFFHQGNSNSIASVDVSAGYIGLEDYQPVVIGLLMALHTYSGPMLWFCARNKLNRTPKDEQPLTIGLTYLTSRALPVAVYTVLVSAQRYHLFVWSVFSPKLLYEGMHTLVVAVLVVILLPVIAARKRQRQNKDL